MANLNVIYRRLANLKPRATNPRTHTKKQFGQLVEKIERFGFTIPVLIDAAGGIVAGHGRIDAAKLLEDTSHGRISL
jgi:ParB-like chromosome segregation protein Spo0J